jgi:hypothetical protein
LAHFHRNVCLSWDGSAEEAIEELLRRKKNNTVPIEDGFAGGMHRPCLWGRSVSRGLDVKIKSCQANQELPGVQQIFRAGPSIAFTYHDRRRI